jgi:hypothetical protein
VNEPVQGQARFEVAVECEDDTGHFIRRTKDKG